MADRDLWVVVAVETAVEWPQGAEVTASFRRRQMILRPETSALWADVSLLRLPDEEEFTATTLVHRFISAVAWKRRAAIRVMGHVGGTHRIRVGGRREPFGAATMLPGFDFDGLAEAPTREQELALALYREAIGIPENTYRFLALFRILNISLSTPSAQIQGSRINWLRWTTRHDREPRSLHGKSSRSTRTSAATSTRRGAMPGPCVHRTVRGPGSRGRHLPHQPRSDRGGSAG
jgi:hypothetical protein